ncbi:MAG: DMT family transporter [Clostridiales bacterium]|nr:DMT family transporter [Clostridiales bacterium]HBM81576.1 EamA/RhaT family transporter [Clostridiaceae bacterium]
MKTLKADLCLLGITVLWGASFPVMSIVLKNKYFLPYSYIAFRNMLAALIMALIFHKRFKKINVIAVKGAFLIGISLLLGSIFQVVGLVYTTPSKSGFITGLNVVFVPVMIAILYKKFPDGKTIFGIILSLIGLGFISINGINGINIGDVLTLLGAICFSSQILFVDRYSRECDVLLLACLETFVVGILAFIPAIGVEGLHIVLNPYSIFALIFTSVFCSAIAMSVQNKMQPLTQPTHAAIIYLAEPVFGAIFSTFIGDALTGRELLGCAFIFLGMIVLNIKFNFSILKTANR